MTDLTIADIFKLQKKRENQVGKAIKRNKKSQIKKTNFLLAAVIALHTTEKWETVDWEYPFARNITSYDWP